MTAFAPISRACCSIISNASSRAFSHSSVKSEMLPPASVCSDAPIVPKIDRERTVMPRTTPRFLETRKPSRVKVVVVISRFMRGDCAPDHARIHRWIDLWLTLDTCDVRPSSRPWKTTMEGEKQIDYDALPGSLVIIQIDENTTAEMMLVLRAALQRILREISSQTLIN